MGGVWLADRAPVAAGCQLKGVGAAARGWTDLRERRACRLSSGRPPLPRNFGNNIVICQYLTVVLYFKYLSGNFLGTL